MTGIDECSDDCGGNGWIVCWNCGGGGSVTVPDDDMTDMEESCDECAGAGGWSCPVCEKREAFAEALHDHRERDQ